MRVDVAERTVQRFVLLGDSISIGIGMLLDGGDRINQRSIRDREQTDRDVQAFHKSRRLRRFAIRTDPLEDHHPVTRLVLARRAETLFPLLDMLACRRVGILDR